MNKKLTDDLTIHDFRCIRNVTLKNLGKINVLIGPNNS